MCTPGLRTRAGCESPTTSVRHPAGARGHSEPVAGLLPRPPVLLASSVELARLAAREPFEHVDRRPLVRPKRVRVALRRRRPAMAAASASCSAPVGGTSRSCPLFGVFFASDTIAREPIAERSIPSMPTAAGSLSASTPRSVSAPVRAPVRRAFAPSISSRSGPWCQPPWITSLINFATRDESNPPRSSSWVMMSVPFGPPPSVRQDPLLPVPRELRLPA